MSKTYTIPELIRGLNTPQTYVQKTEEQLSQADKDFLLGKLLADWNNTPKSEQQIFIKRYAEQVSI